MSGHGPEHEERLARVLAGEPDAETEARLAECPQCRAELARLAPLAEGLRRLAAQERADLVRARAVAGDTERALVRASLGRALAARSPGRRRSLGLALAAAAVLLLLGWALRGRFGGGPREEVLLGGGAVECLAPRGKAAFDEFRWRYDLPPLGTYVLRVHALEDGAQGAELLELELDEPRWTPSAEQRTAFPDAIRWEVVAHDAGGDRLAHGWAVASRP